MNFMALALRNRRRRVVFLAACSVLVFFVLVQWYSVTSPKGPSHSAALTQLYGWLSSRAMPDYIRPDDNTTLLQPRRSCQSAAPPLLAMMVTSAPSHAAARGAIRSSWGRSEAGTAAFFLVGRSREPATQAALAAEADEHGDLIQEDFIDHYQNLTLKTVFMLKWLSAHCRGARFTLKVDDDIWVDMPALLGQLRTCQLADGVCGGRPLVAGRVFRASSPVRQPASKYYLPPTFLAGDRLPDFVSGTYLISQAAVAPLYRQALLTPYVNLEDVFLNGLVATAAHVPLRDVPGFLPYHPCWVTTCTCRGYLTVHGVSPEDMLRLQADRHTDCDGLLASTFKKLALLVLGAEC